MLMRRGGSLGGGLWLLIALTAPERASVPLLPRLSSPPSPP